MRHIIPQSKGRGKAEVSKKTSLSNFHVYGLVELDQLAKNNERTFREDKTRGQGKKCLQIEGVQ